MSNDLLSVGGVTTVLVFILTLLFQYVPVLRVKWGSVPREHKKLIVLGTYIVVGAFIAFGGCLPFLLALLPSLLCVSAMPFFEYVIAVAGAIAVGQGVFSLMPELDDVTVAKDNRPY